VKLPRTVVALCALAPAIARGDVGAPDGRDAALLAACGPGDATLGEVAARIARRRLGGMPAPASDEIAAELRDAGSTLPTVRALTLMGDSRGDDGAARVRKWVSGGSGRRRCGVGSADDGGRLATVILSAPALADVAAVPSSVRVGAWVTIDARVLGEPNGARVVILGPAGPPRGVPTSLHEGRVVARFSADRPGRWLAQIVAELDGGPRPVAEVVVRAGDQDAEEPPIPGLAATGATDVATLRAMLDAARQAEGLRALHTDPELDRLAARHAARMAERSVVAHDAGEGDPAERLEASGVTPREVGENVAHAGSPAGAHRMIWASPSHRANLLSSRFDAVGVGVSRGKDGSVWVAELFVAR
jgi:hypothetical protein